MWAVVVVIGYVVGFICLVFNVMGECFVHHWGSLKCFAL